MLFVILFSLTYLNNLFSQDSLVVVSTVSVPTVYRNVQNPVKIGFDKMNEPYDLECFGCIITDMDSLGNKLPKHNYLLTPGVTMIVYLDVYTFSDSQNKIKLARLEFLNIDLPPPDLHVGVVFDTDSSSWNKLSLLAYYPIIPSDYSFKVVDWSLELGRKKYSGSGEYIDGKVLKKIERLKTEKKFKISAQVIGPDNEKRMVVAYYYKSIDGIIRC